MLIRRVCAFCAVPRLLTVYRPAADTVCRRCRKAERVGARLPLHLAAGGAADRYPVLGPTTRAARARWRAMDRRPLPPGLTSARARQIARWLIERGAPGPWTARTVYAACRGAPSVRAVWPECTL